LEKQERNTHVARSAPILVPSYAAVLLVQKLWEAERERTFDIIEVAYEALVEVIQTHPPKYILLSIADFESKVRSIRENALALLKLASKCKSHVIMDSGSLESSMLSLLNDGQWLRDPIKNIEDQLGLGYKPKIVTLLDDLNSTCTFEPAVRCSQGLVQTVNRARTEGVEILFVLHGKDCDSPMLVEFLNSDLMSLIDYIAIPDDELGISNDLFTHVNGLGKKLAVFGLDDLSPPRLIKLAGDQVYLADVLRWVTGKIGPGGYTDSVFDNPSYWRQLPPTEFRRILNDNLLMLQELSPASSLTRL
jgi:hypothetical protein